VTHFRSLAQLVYDQLTIRWTDTLTNKPVSDVARLPALPRSADVVHNTSRAADRQPQKRCLTIRVADS